VTWAKLDILDPHGKLVRSSSSEDKPGVTLEQLGKELKVPRRRIRPPQMLLAEAGIHRFVRNMRIPALQSLFHELPSPQFHMTHRATRSARLCCPECMW
jgi:uncharacterized protein YpbB